jgi:predicted Zn-dependent protease
MAPIADTFLPGSPIVSGLQATDYFNYNNTPNIYNFQEDWNVTLGNGSQAFANFTGSGKYINGNEGGALQNYGYLGNGGELETTQVTNGTGPDQNKFNATLPQNNATALDEAQTAWEENNLLFQAAPSAALTSDLSVVSQASSSGVPAPSANQYDQALYEGAKWNKNNVITWSIATSPGKDDSPFSSYIGKQYQALIEKAFQTWAKASGLNLEEVSDSSQSDIRVGWGGFNTSASGVVGYTTYQTQSGQLQPGVTIRLEDPSQTSLVGGPGGGLTYAGTKADLYQVMLHEVGHALGFADNADPNSMMYYQATGANNTFDSNDIGGIQTLYGSASPSAGMQALEAAGSELSGASMAKMVQQMTQSIASFQPQTAASALALSAPSETQTTSLAANPLH